MFRRDLRDSLRAGRRTMTAGVIATTRCALASALLCTAACGAARNAHPVTIPAVNVEESEARLQKATISGDRAAQGSLLAADYMLVTSAGTFSRDVVVTGLEIFMSVAEDVHVFVDGAGDSAVVTFTAIRVRPTTFERARVVRVWRLEPDRVWRAQFEQRTDIK
jgi:hypothetical protein